MSRKSRRVYCRKRYLSWAACGIFWIGCKARPGSAPNESSETQGLYAPDATWPSATASVCFDDHDAGTASQREEIQTIVEEEINSPSPFRFSGFELCSRMPSADIRVSVPPKGTSSSDVGKMEGKWRIDQFLSHFSRSPKSQQRMKLFQNDAKGKYITLPLRHNIVVHEFGHAMGLYHEHRRKENGNGEFCKTKEDAVGSQPNGSVAVGKFDSASIMNYCVPNYFNEYVSLSAGDIATLRQMYPGKPAGRNLGPQLRCIRWKLLDCVKVHDGKDCLTKACSGGSTVCQLPEVLASCLENRGGQSCLDERHGKCKL